MKGVRDFPVRCCICIAAIVLLASSFISVAVPIGNAFTYQGRLATSGAPASGSYDISFTLFDAAVAGAATSQTLTNTATAVTNGLFTVSLNFGGATFTGDARWLEVSARTNGATNFTAISPRHALTATPYALTALNLAGSATNFVSPSSLLNLSNQLVAVSNSAMAAIIASTNAALFTNAFSVNAIQRGAMPDGVTDNTILFSNLFNAGGAVFIPPGIYAHGPIIVNATSAPVSIYGSGDVTRLRYTGSGNSFGITFSPASCVIRRLNFSHASVGSGFAFFASGGAVRLNAVGFPGVEDCSFNSVAGNSVYLQGDPGITFRSNHWAVISCTFSNVYNGIVCATNNRTEYGSILGNRMSIILGTGIWLGGANTIVANNNINGSQDFEGGYGPVISTGLRFWSDNGRGHSFIANNLLCHHATGIDIRNAGNVTLVANSLAGCASNHISDSSEVLLSFNLFETYSSSGTRMVNCNNPTVMGNHFYGVVAGFNNYIGVGNVLGGAGPFTNDFVSAPRGANLGPTTITGNLTASGITKSGYLTAQGGVGFQNGPVWTTNNSPTRLTLVDWNAGATLRPTETGGDIIFRTNAWTTAELAPGRHATWNSNASGAIFMSINVGGIVTNKLVVP